MFLGIQVANWNEDQLTRGKAAVFTYNGATRRLVWDDKQSEGGVEEYRPCP